jgi:RNA polymerase sigma factor (sigma-70 family)
MLVERAASREPTERGHQQAVLQPISGCATLELNGFERGGRVKIPNGNSPVRISICPHATVQYSGGGHGMGKVTPMAHGHLGNLLDRFRDLFGGATSSDVTDGQLLERFITRRDEGAFQMLVKRHGPLVFGTCRRVLRDAHAAEDAFQATFLVLVRRAQSLDRRGSLSGWLYGVAYRIALRARAQAGRRQNHEQQVDAVNELPDPTTTSADLPSQSDRDELRSVLDEEMHRLPTKYREPLVLCYLRGKTNEQAARELGRPAGSMSRHLTRARELLQERLARRGVAVSAVLLGPLVTECSAAVVPPALTSQLVQAALQLAAGRPAHRSGLDRDRRFYRRSFASHGDDQIASRHSHTGDRRANGHKHGSVPASAGRRPAGLRLGWRRACRKQRGSPGPARDHFHCS